MENGEVITDHWEDCKDSCFDREESVGENGEKGLYSVGYLSSNYHITQC